MKIEILKTVVDSFIDYAGVERNFVVAAVASKQGPLTKMFGIGFSVCHPGDEFNEEIGIQIAVNKALNKDNKLLSYVNCNGFLTPNMVDTLVSQEIAYFKAKPSSHIAGYNALKDKYEENIAITNKITNLINNYGQHIQGLMTLNNEEKQLVIKMLNGDN